MYTYLYPLERHYERSEIDSVNRYFDLLNNVKSDNHPNTLNNIVQANLKKSWTYLKFGDIGTSQMILEDFFVSENYQKLTTEDKIWYLNSYGESLTDINTPESLLKSKIIHDKAISMGHNLPKYNNNKRLLQSLNEFGKARSLRRLGELHQAQKGFERALNFFESTDLSLYSAVTQSELAHVFFAQNKLQSAKSYLNKSIKNFEKNKDQYFPYSPEPYILLSEILTEQDSLEKASKISTRGVILSSNGPISELLQKPIEKQLNAVLSTTLLYNLSVTYERYGRIDDSKRIAEIAFELFHRITPEHLDYRSKILLKQSQEDLFRHIEKIYLRHSQIDSLFFKVDRNKHSLIIADKFQHVNSNFALPSNTLQYFENQGESSFILYQDSKYRLHAYRNAFETMNDIENDYITIIPDVFTSNISFGALLQDSTDHSSFLEKDYIISYQLSASLWQELVSKQVDSDGIGIIAPQFDQDPNDIYASVRGYRGDSINLYHLPYASEEVNSISSSLGEVDISYDKASLVNAIQSKRILHFAGHGVTFPDDSDNSFLALGSDIDDPSQKLTLRELYDLESNNELVVLSACSTAEGEIAEGEGVLSLARGFFYSGAKSVVSTLWAVNDQSSAIIMAEFYKQLKKGKRKDVALQQAKLHYLDSVDPEYQNPKYWAAFIVMGDMSPIFTPWWHYLSYGIIGFVVVMMIYLIGRRFLRT